MSERRFPPQRQGRLQGQASSTLAFRMALSTLGVLVCIVAADLSEVKAFTLLFGLAFSLALWSEIARVMRLRLWGVPLAVAVVAWAAGFAVILAAAAFRLGWESVVFMLIFLAIWHLAGAEQPITKNAFPPLPIMVDISDDTLLI